MIPDLRARLEASLGAAYTVECELGGGGMSRVFLATERALGRPVVIKVLPEDLGSVVSAERFQREIALAARLQHPHIVPLLTAGEVGDLPYYIMPFVEGESLRARLAGSGELPINEGVRLLREVAAALGYAHEHGIVHRDLKPENILLSGGIAVLTDFGVAKALSAAGTTAAGTTSVGLAIGTPAYMAPEQGVADPSVDHRADLYAWGVLAYEVLTGSLPFAGRSAQALLAAHAIETPDALDRRRPGVPPALVSLVARCLEKRPSDRPASAAEVVAALDALVTPSSGTRPARAPAGRRRVALIGAALLAAAVVVAAILRPRSNATAPVTSLAVLPIEVAAGDSTLDYLADGLTDGLQEEMRRSGLRVAARASSNWFKGKVAQPQDVAKKLDVQSVLSVSMRRLGTRLRVSAELYDASGFSLWSGSVEREAADPLALQDEIQLALVAAFKDGLANRTVAVAPRIHTPDPVTYDLFLRGRHWAQDPTRAGLERARDYFLAAIARDSLYTPAYIELSGVYTWLADGYYSPTAVIPQALAAARRAVELDDGSAAAHAQLGLLSFYERKWEEGDRELTRAVALDPTNSEAHLWQVWNPIRQGRHQEMVDAVLTSVRLNPLSPWGLHVGVGLLGWLEEPDSALALHQRAMEIAPDFFYEEAWVGEAYRAAGRLEEALAAERAAEPILLRPTGGSVVTLARMGRREEALTAMRAIEAWIAKGNYAAPEWVARGWIALGNTDRAMDYLEKGLDNLSLGVSVIRLIPEMRQMPRTERFQRYLEKANLAPFFENPPASPPAASRSGGPSPQ